MSYIPLALFFFAVAWIVWRGYSARRDDFRRAADMAARTSSEAASERLMQSITSAQGQGQAPELARMLGGDRKTSANTIGFQPPPAIQR